MQTLPPERLRPGPILRDIAIVFVLTFFGGCMVGSLSATRGHEGPPSVLLLAASNLALGTIGFTLSGVMAPPSNRWLHLTWVAFGAWLTGLINVVMGMPVMQWAVGILFVMAMMGVGGLLSMLFRPTRSG
jgi:FtsH-binding integral membrane protein